MRIFYIISAVYLAVMNLITLITYGIDKSKAKKGRWRISEKALILLAAVGGSIGALLGMYGFHHKTKHLKFTIGVPIILILQIIILTVGYLYFKA